METLIIETGLSFNDLALKLTLLRNLGFNIVRKYYSTNNILTISKSINEKEVVNINVKQKFRFLAIADTHYGSICENCELGDAVFEYAIINGIHYIFHAGDFFEGLYFTNGRKNPDSTSVSTIDEAYHFLKKYPQDLSIHTLGILGNHDIRSQISDGIDLMKFIETHRPDITILGKEFGPIKMGEDFVILHHPLHKRNNYDKEVFNYCNDNNINSRLVVRGHFHKSDSYANEQNNIILLTPSLSETSQKPGAWDVTIEFMKVNNKIEMYEIVCIPLTFKNKLVRNETIYRKVLH